MLDKIPNWVKNKYVITSVVFAIFITFINDIDLIYVLNSKADLNNLKDEVARLKTENLHLNEVLSDYKENKETAEKFARENYYMHKENEDLYIVKNVKSED